MKWALRLMAVMFAVGVADIVVVMVAPHPLPWAAIIPGFVPVLTAVFVIIPMMRAEKL